MSVYVCSHECTLFLPFQQSCFLACKEFLLPARFVNTVLTWLINPIVLGSVIVFIGFWLIIVRGKLKRYFRESNKLKEEFDKYRREMQLKVSITAPKLLACFCMLFSVVPEM